MHHRLLLVLILVALVAVGVVDLVVFPDQHLALLYVIPLAIAAYRAPVGVVMLAAMAAFVLDFLSFEASNAPLGVWFLSFGALVIVCVLAFLQASEMPLRR